LSVDRRLAGHLQKKPVFLPILRNILSK
jgi:hypothetical protein